MNLFTRKTYICSGGLRVPFGNARQVVADSCDFPALVRSISHLRSGFAFCERIKLSA